MLRNEHRMPPHRRLPPVVRRLGRREPFGDEVSGMVPHDLDATGV